MNVVASSPEGLEKSLAEEISNLGGFNINTYKRFIDFEEEKNEEVIIKQSRLLVNFFGGFIGSVIGTLTILFLYINEYLPLDLLKLK